ncbi:hypothetical protein [Methylobacterium sp.]|uniref:hypothetical protein n=1 Tax=Methylobacterium sp. TaxID=409 RepID=UPI003AFFFB4D
MNGSQSSVIDLVAGAASKRQTIEQRLERRLEVLREWHREGIPAGKTIPKDLKAARTWEDPDLGILSIGSPNEFTSTHHVHGPRVKDIAALLTALKKRFGRPVTKSMAQGSEIATKFDRRAFDRQVEAMVSQWHTERDLRLQEKRRADAAEARSIMLLEENAQKDDLIADLRRQLTSHKGLRVV